jgi:hypothetical protein
VSGFALVTPKGKILADTFDVDKEMAEAKAYDLLFARYTWPRKYWKCWDGFIKERERRGWYVFPVKLRLS